MNVTPDNEAPIIPKATKYHGADLLALKNALLFCAPLVKRATSIKTAKYARTIVMRRKPLIII
jgi:hypothetical protein